MIFVAASEKAFSVRETIRLRSPSFDSMVLLAGKGVGEDEGRMVSPTILLSPV